jgi:hypothetical protein
MMMLNLLRACYSNSASLRRVVYNLSRFQSRENLIIIIELLQADRSTVYIFLILTCTYFVMVERPNEICQSFITEFSRCDVCAVYYLLQNARGLGTRLPIHHVVPRKKEALQSCSSQSRKKTKGASLIYPCGYTCTV